MEDNFPRNIELVEFFEVEPTILDKDPDLSWAHNELQFTARPDKRNSGYIREAVIEVDKETKVVKRLELQRSFRWRSDSRITFTLVDARTPDESRYEPTGHLDEQYRILARNLHPDKRRDVLTSWFGPNAARWIVEPSKSEALEAD